MTEYLIGTGGWAYLNVPGKSSLKAYSEIFNSVEVNYTFYEYPDAKTVERWRRTVPQDFTFTVRCHQDLTHRIGLRPVEEAYPLYGVYDIIAMTKAETMDEIKEIHNKIRKLERVRQTLTLIAHEE
jgi:uncharacterized protein YecE (DUF72 family)